MKRYYSLTKSTVPSYKLLQFNMLIFHVADLNTRGELRQIADYDYATLELIPGAADLISRCSAQLWQTPAEFEIPLNENRKTFIRWRATADSAGVLTVRRDTNDLVSLSLLAAGRDKEADSTTLDVLQKHLVRELRQTPFEPAFDLMQITERPLIATITFANDENKGDEPLIEALADRSFAASYFRYLGLA
jgi:hypothetical protein